MEKFEMMAANVESAFRSEATLRKLELHMLFHARFRRSVADEILGHNLESPRATPVTASHEDRDHLHGRLGLQADGLKGNRIF